jgi:hypothetical protein
MRQGQQNNKRMRGRNRKGPNPLTRSFESNGPDVKIRGTALHIAEKYLQLARDAQSSGDRVAGENYLQHAEHYFRIVAAAQAQLPQQQQNFRSDDDEGDDEDDRANGYGDGERLPHQQQAAQPGYGLSDPQPYLNGGNGQGPQQGPQGGPQGHQPGFEGGQGDEPRFDGQGGQHRDHRDNRDHGGFRGRRRRPYRGDRFAGGNDQREQGGGDHNYGGNQPSPGAGPVDD